MISYEESLIEKSLTEMKKSEEKLYIWGTGELGVKIGRFLKRKGIDFQGYVVDRKYADGSPKELLEHPVYILEDHMRNHGGELIVAFAGYTGNLLEGGDLNVDKVYALDFMGYLVIEEENSLCKKMYEENKDKIAWLEENLADRKSVEVYKTYLSQKMTGIYAKPYDTTEQYFDFSIYDLKDAEVFIDGGAFQGETAECFIRQMEMAGKQYKKIYAVEADRENADTARKRLKGQADIEVIEAGIWDHSGKIHFMEGGGDNSLICDEGNVEINTIKIDDIAKEENVTFIKLDIEGAEMKALQGAENVIRRCRPKLAVCVYHRPEDLFTIPQYIKELNLDYKLYLRKYQPYGIETVLYAV